MAETEEPPSSRPRHYRRALRFEYGLGTDTRRRRPAAAAHERGPPAARPRAAKPREPGRRRARRLRRRGRHRSAGRHRPRRGGRHRHALPPLPHPRRHWSRPSTPPNSTLSPTAPRRCWRNLPPERALRAWMERYAAFVATKRAMLNALRTGWAAGRLATAATRERITRRHRRPPRGRSADGLAARGRRTRRRHRDAPRGVPRLRRRPTTPERTGRLLDLVVDALRPPGSS